MRIYTVYSTIFWGVDGFDDTILFSFWGFAPLISADFSDGDVLSFSGGKDPPHQGSTRVYTLPETNSEFTPENGWLEDEISFWDGLFGGAK